MDTLAQKDSGQYDQRFDYACIATPRLVIVDVERGDK